MKQQLIFVYNANNDLFSSLTNFTHKIISPSTYSCSLCALTYGSFLIKQEWKTFVQQLPAETTFLHKNEFEKSYHLQTKLPAVFIKEDDQLKLLVSCEKIDNCNSLQQLKDLVSLQLASYGQHHHSNI